MVEIETINNRKDIVKNIEYGQLNGHSIVMVLKDIMRRAMEEIHKRRIAFIGQVKINPHKADPKDLVTDADFAAQEIFVRKITECFPGYGLVAEEKGLKLECTIPGENLFFTVDPLDGTKAFGRRQSSGFGPMLALCNGEEVISAFVGDAMTGELYYFRPGSERAHRLNFRDMSCEQLVVNTETPLEEQYVLIRDNPLELPGFIRNVAQSRKHGGLFKEIEVQGGGIGTGMARLWKGEIGGYVIKSGPGEAWDLMPVLGLSKQLGFIWMTFEERWRKWTQRDIKASMERTEFNEPTIIIHHSRYAEFLARANMITDK